MSRAQARRQQTRSMRIKLNTEFGPEAIHVLIFVEFPPQLRWQWPRAICLTRCLSAASRMGRLRPGDARQRRPGGKQRHT